MSGLEHMNMLATRLQDAESHVNRSRVYAQDDFVNGSGIGAQGILNLQGMTKSTFKPPWTSAWESRVTGILNHRLWGLGLRVLPWLGLVVLLWQARERFADLSAYSWDSSLWSSVWLLPSGEFLLPCFILLLVIPMLSLWVDSLKWIILMHPSLALGAAMKMGWRICPLVGYGMMGSLAVPGRLSEFAGRCRFYPLVQHPRVMASTLMASSTQWVWVLVWPALWILGHSILTSDVMERSVPLNAFLKALPDELRKALSNPIWGGILLGLAAVAAMLWLRIYRSLQMHGWLTRSLIQVYFWSLIRYGLLVLQWVLWLALAGLAIDSWFLLGVIGVMLALQWFMPLGMFMDLGFKGALSFWIWGDVLANAVDALWIPLLIWITNLAIPALIGGIWWWMIGHKSKVL